MGTQPTGTITLLFTDIVGSSALWEANAEKMAAALVRHDALLERAAADHCGYVFKRVGDGFCIAFDTAVDALRAAVTGQIVLAAEPWATADPITVRMGLHSGVVDIRDGDYFGPAVNRAARVQGLAHGGQILVSQSTWQLLAGQQLSDIDWVDLGNHQLAGLARPERIFQLVMPDLPGNFPPIKSLTVCANNLPEQPTPFVGRSSELARLEGLLSADSWRLITIVGPGGMGKTRLALELARRQCMPRPKDDGQPPLPFPDGVFFVALAGAETPAEILPAICQAMGFQPAAQDPGGRSPWQQLLEYLGNSQMLLVLDNFEQLTESAGMVGELIAAASRLTVVVTSREQLSLRGEQLFTLGGMHYPAILDGSELPKLRSEFSALALLLQSCERVDPAMEWTEEQLEQSIQICRLLGGMPLAIELAAGWVEMLLLAEIAAEIQRDLDFLQTDVKDVDARHRSVAAIFDGTWTRLGPDDQALFARLCVFRGGFTRAAAQEVTGASLLQLSRQVKRSLLQHDRDLDRYQIHRLLRQYGEQKLTTDTVADTEIRDGHCAYYGQRMESWGRLLRGPRQMEVTTRFDLEFANCRAAWSWAVKRRALQWVDHSVNALGQYCAWRLLQDQLESICESAATMLALETTADSRRVLAKVLAWNGWFRPAEDSRRMVKQSLEILQEAEANDIDVGAEKAFALGRLGLLTRDIDQELSFKQLKTALGLAEAKEVQWLRMMILSDLVQCTHRWAMRTTARRYIELKTELHRELDDRRGLAESLQLQGINTMYTGEFDFGRRCYEESIALSREVADPALLLDNLGWLATLLILDGRFGEAKAASDEQLSLLASVPYHRAWPSGIKSGVLIHQGEYQAALEVVEEALKWLENAGDTDPQNDLMTYKGAALLAQGQRSEARSWLKKSLAIPGQGQLFLVGTASYLAIARTTLESLCQTIEAAIKAQAVPGYVMVVPTLARYFLEQGNVEQAIEYYSLACKYGMVANSVWYDDLVGRPVAEAAASLPDAVVEAAKARGAQRELEPTVAELAAEFCLKENGRLIRA